MDIIIPVLRRPHRAAPFMDSLRASCDRRDATPIAVADADDTETVRAWSAAGVPVLILPEPPGTFARKANYGYRMRSAAWTLFVGDDVEFHAGWLDAAMEVAEATSAQVIGTNDLGSQRVRAGEHATHLLISRDYVDTVGASWDGPGVVFSEAYLHQYCDNEAVDAARARGTWAFAADSVVEHLHPAFGKGESDPVYEIGNAAGPADLAVYQERRAKHVQ